MTNAMPSRTPCTAAVRKVPISVEMVTSLKRLRSASAFSREKGMSGSISRHMCRGVRSR